MGDSIGPNPNNKRSDRRPGSKIFDPDPPLVQVINAPYRKDHVKFMNDSFLIFLSTLEL